MKQLLLLFLFGLCLSAAKYVKIVDTITSEFAREMRKEKNMRVFGYGGKMMKDVEEIYLSFHATKEVSIDEARMLFIEMTEKYLSRINNNPQLRPFLRHYPFTIDNLTFCIGFENEEHDYQANLALVMYCKKTGNLVYDAYDLEQQKFRTLQEEPYTAALERIKGH